MVKKQNPADLSSLSNRELLELMSDLADSGDEEFDDELFSEAEKLLDERAPLNIHIDADEALAEFKAEHKDLFEQAARDDDAARSADKPKKRIMHYIVRGAAAVIVIVFAINLVAAIAMGSNPIQPAIDFGETLLRLVTYGASGTLELPEGIEGYRSLDEALEDTGAMDIKCLTWIPKDFVIANVRVEYKDINNINYYKYWAFYENASGDSILYHIEQRQQNSMAFITEKNPGLETLTVDGVQYDVVNNNDYVQARWYDENYDYLISGNIESEQLKTMLKSLK